MNQRRCGYQCVTMRSWVWYIQLCTTLCNDDINR